MPRTCVHNGGEEETQPLEGDVDEHEADRADSSLDNGVSHRFMAEIDWSYPDVEWL